MISDERLLFKLKTPTLCTTDEIEMAKELLALRRVLPKDGEVLIALSRVEGYEDVSAELVAEDAMNNPEPWPEWRLVDIGA